LTTFKIIYTNGPHKSKNKNKKIRYYIYVYKKSILFGSVLVIN